IGSSAVLYHKGVFQKRLRYCLGLATNHTVYNAECTGLVLGAHLLSTLPIGSYISVSFAVDNQAAISAAGNHHSLSGHHIIDQFLELLLTILDCTPLARRPTIFIRWVPGHQDMPGNEHANTEAKNAITLGSSPQQLLPCYLHTTLPANKAVLCTTHRATLITHLSNSWRKSRFGKTNRIIPLHHFSKLRNVFFSLPRKLSTLVGYLITNHNRLHHHLHRIGKSPSPECHKCHHGAETTDHFLFQCTAYAVANNTLARACSLSHARLTLGTLLASPKRIAALFTYIRSTERFNRTLGPLPQWDPPDE
ncbi:hypothetical protein BDQ17DRAFT_1259946, partial [Cyathus striatus]